MSEDPAAILERVLAHGAADPATPAIADPALSADIEYLCHCSNRAGVRLLMACLLAKIHDPHIDPRKPYTQISGPDSFSGRYYDAAFVERFVITNRLPVN